MTKIKVAILISGKGSNAMNLIKHERLNEVCEFFILSSKINPFLASFCKDYQVDFIHFDYDQKKSELLNLLKNHFINLIVLAGFLKLIPKEIILNYNNLIINLHPSLLPKFGGKGMYGYKVHQAVFEAGESITGITIHFVNEEYDKGEIIEQHSINVEECSSPREIEKKIQGLEKIKFPEVLIRFIQRTF